MAPNLGHFGQKFKALGGQARQLFIWGLFGRHFRSSKFLGRNLNFWDLNFLIFILKFYFNFIFSLLLFFLFYLFSSYSIFLILFFLFYLFL